ncbi:AmmeMemoRadiSam system radical SAM enzyme [Candidatus Micrarchaeota archaeon]|nr:AmmeMemoRadiSam system radical SAM enzyme [Candidatus Micrarchaeota archaeon]
MDKLHEAMLYEKMDEKKVRCRLCARYCTIPERSWGFCFTRKNVGGKLYTMTYGKSTGFSIDPIEKKPFFHFHPGSSSLSFGTPGCNFRCLNCQNYFLSQAAAKRMEDAFDIEETPPKQVAEMALETDGVSYTYSEPTIFFEYAYDCIKETKKLNPELYHVFVTNGYFSKECFELIKKEKLLNAMRIDLKAFREEFYNKICSASLAPVLENIERVRKEKSWLHLEIICLIIPGKNDSEKELKEMSSWIASQGKDIPVHFLRFFPHYKMANILPTPDETLLKAKKIAEAEGLEYVYLGNTPLEGGEDTRCPKCKTLLVRREFMRVTENKVTADGKCPGCGKKINLVV